MGWLASESVAVNFEQPEQIRQLESFYSEAIEMSRVEEKAAATEAGTIAGKVSRNTFTSSKRSLLKSQKISAKLPCHPGKTRFCMRDASAPVLVRAGLCGRAWAKRIGPLPLTKSENVPLFIAATF